MYFEEKKRLIKYIYFQFMIGFSLYFLNFSILLRRDVFPQT